MFKVDELKPVRRMWVKLSNVPGNRKGWTLDDCTIVSSKVMGRVKQWLGDLRNDEVIRADGSKRCGKGLLLWGEPGHGKTTLALSIIQELMTKSELKTFKPGGHSLIRPCYFSTFNYILALKGKVIDGTITEDESLILKGMMGECEDDAYNIRVLIIDDLGKEHTTLSGWQSSVFHDILRTRFHHGLPTIVTTNIRLENWASEYGDATESFANEAMYYLAVVTDNDLRK